MTAEASMPRPPLGAGWDRFERWRGQYDRMLRWRERLVHAHAEADLAEGWANEAWDIAFAFFQNAYHLKDWILTDRPDLKSSLETLIKTNSPLQFCADICNGTKHREVTRGHRVSSHLAGAREYAPHEPTKQRLVVIGPTGPRPVLELAEECVCAWQSYIDAHLQVSVDGTHQAGSDT